MFLAEGFDRASLGQIAQRAGVSKQTIYSHFADKEALFKAICAELTEKLTIPLREALNPGADLRAALIRLGEDALAMMLHPASLDLHRLIVSAATRYPELGRAAYEAGAARMIEDLGTLIGERSRSGDGFTRAIDEPRAQLLAEQFIGMLRGFHQARGLLGVPPAPAEARQHYVQACVDLLLRGV
jgi:TetR/AcrR family transcriptional repressor of mexJK operon